MDCGDNLTPEDIRRLLEDVGSYCLVVYAANAETVSNPINWANGTEAPTPDQMERLVVLRETFLIMKGVKNLSETKHRMRFEMEILEYIRTGEFHDALQMVATMSDSLEE